MTVEIQLTQGRVAIVDADDLHLVSGHKWCARRDESGRWYAVTGVRDESGRWTTTRMHRLILGAVAGQSVDHVNGDGLNNSRSNLRIATVAQNAWNRDKQINNTSGYKGVSLSKSSGKWLAQIVHNGAHLHIGLFDTKTVAAFAYDQMAIKLHGAFARLNFPTKDYENMPPLYMQKIGVK